MFKKRVLLFCREKVRTYRSKIYLWGREKRNQAPTEQRKTKAKPPILDIIFFHEKEEKHDITGPELYPWSHSAFLHFYVVYTIQTNIISTFSQSRTSIVRETSKGIVHREIA